MEEKFSIMSPKFIDLHLHSNASDGNFSPSRIVANAKKLGLKAIAIADHDTINGINEGIIASAKENIEFIPAVELTTIYKQGETHVLGYFIDLQNKPLIERFSIAQELRENRILQMINKLQRLGIMISYSSLKSKYSFIERFQLALEMLSLGYVQTVDEAYKKYLNPDAAAFVKLESIRTEEAIALIKQAGGIAQLSHPGGFDLNERQFCKQDLIYLKEQGLDGIEVYSIFHSKEKIEHFYLMAKELNLAISGGSDCHGDACNPPRIGCLKIEYKILEDLKRYYQQGDIIY